MATDVLGEQMTTEASPAQTAEPEEGYDGQDVSVGRPLQDQEEEVVPLRASSVLIKLVMLCAIVTAATMAFVCGWLGTLYVFNTDVLQRYSPLVFQARRLGVIGSPSNGTLNKDVAGVPATASVNVTTYHSKLPSSALGRSKPDERAPYDFEW